MTPSQQTRRSVFLSFALTCGSLILLGGCATAPKLAPNAGPIERDIHTQYTEIEDRIGDKGFQRRAAARFPPGAPQAPYRGVV